MVHDTFSVAVIQEGIEGWLFSRGMDNPDDRARIASIILQFIESAQRVQEKSLTNTVVAATNP